MHDPVPRRHGGSPPGEELWSLGALARDGRGLWLRHVITDGADAHLRGLGDRLRATSLDSRAGASEIGTRQPRTPVLAG